MNDPPRLHQPGVLAVDDDPRVLGFIQAALPACGFRVWAASGADEALDLLRRHGGDIDAAVLGVRLLGDPAPGLLARLRQQWGDLPAVFVSSHWGLDLPCLQVAPLPAEPFSAGAMAHLLREQMGREHHRRWVG